jgi:hypothetical protein
VSVDHFTGSGPHQVVRPCGPRERERHGADPRQDADVGPAGLTQQFDDLARLEPRATVAYGPQPQGGLCKRVGGRIVPTDDDLTA